MIPREDYFPQIDAELAALVRKHDLELFGVAAAPQADDGGRGRAEREYAGWIEAGHHGEMDYLRRHARMKYAPEEVLGGCESVLIVGMNYFQETRRDAEPGSGRIARYAWGRDYHNALGKRLRRIAKELRRRFPDDDFRPFVDASPLSERFFAEQAGVGYTARNTLTISSAYGSWFFLGEILSTRRFAPTPLDAPRHGACPSNCFRCGTACPTDALYNHHRIDARRCISYLTIEHRGSIDPELRPLMGDWVFGCDLCQEVCPLNVRSRETSIGDFTAHRAGERLRLEELLAIPDDEAYRRRFAGTPLLRPGRDAMVRNACIAAANTTAHSLRQRLTELANDHSALVREHARWALDRLA
ncbi:MAG: tRNA epoxyqueuosine(34) reductase QueG [Spirochaetota bacterium]